MYNMAMAKNDFREGWINEFKVYRKDAGWVLEISKDGGITKNLYQTRGGIRIFGTIDAAVNAASQIGFSVHCLKFILI